MKYLDDVPLEETNLIDTVHTEQKKFIGHYLKYADEEDSRLGAGK